MPGTILGSGGQGRLPEAQVGEERSKQAKLVTVIQPQGSRRKSAEVTEAQRRGTSLGQWRWILVGFQEELTSKLMFEQWVCSDLSKSPCGWV